MCGLGFNQLISASAFFCTSFSTLSFSFFFLQNLLPRDFFLYRQFDSLQSNEGLVLLLLQLYFELGSFCLEGLACLFLSLELSGKLRSAGGLLLESYFQVLYLLLHHFMESPRLSLQLIDWLLVLALPVSIKFFLMGGSVFLKLISEFQVCALSFWSVLVKRPTCFHRNLFSFLCLPPGGELCSLFLLTHNVLGGESSSSSPVT